MRGFKISPVSLDFKLTPIFYTVRRYKKEFERWNIVKQKINNKKKVKVNIRSGDIRWIIFGVNVGSEIDGKGESFLRPALVVNVSGKNTALVIPMSTKIKDIPGYLSFEWKGQVVSLCISQMKVISQKRILHRLGRIADTKLPILKGAIRLFFRL